MNDRFRAVGPGDIVKVIDGTFSGMSARVVSHEEAKTFCESKGGHFPLIKSPGSIWVVISIFGRPVPVRLEQFQVSRAADF